MSKKTIIIILTIILIVGTMILSISWYRLTDFYKDCEKIQVGMNQAEIENILKPYLDSDRFNYSREGALWGPGLYVSSNFSGNACNVSIKEGMVDKVEARFE